MNRASNIAFIVSIGIAGAALIGEWGPQAGIGLFIFLAVWLFLTIPRRGVLRKKWEDKLNINRLFNIDLGSKSQFGEKGEEGFPDSVTGERCILKLDISITTVPSVSVDSIELELGPKRLISNWGSFTVHNNRLGYIYFGIPSWVKPKKQSVRLVARFNTKEWKSESSIIDFTPIETIRCYK